MDPFLKWAGGKRWLASSKLLPLPQSYSRYIEPFLGGGAIFFHLQPRYSVLSDLNADLIELYEVVRDSPEELVDRLRLHHLSHCNDHYYFVRSLRPACQLERAARTLYLNRTCWNGLYRVNLKGEFNVPIGTKSAVLSDGEDFLAAAKALTTASLRCCDFEETVDDAGEGDFLFVDPPYTVQHNMNGFVKYNEQIFSWRDQLRLRDAVKRAAYRGASVVVTNADHVSVRELYEEVCDYRQLTRSTVLAGTGGRRGVTSEALFMANL